MRVVSEDSKGCDLEVNGENYRLEVAGWEDADIFVRSSFKAAAFVFVLNNPDTEFENRELFQIRKTT